MIRLSLSVLIIVFIFSFNNSASAQVIFSNITDNPALRGQDQTGLEERNYISSKRVVLLPGGSQKICISRPDLGVFDTLTYSSTSIPDDIDLTIDLNCVTITAHNNAALGSMDLPFEYVTSDSSILNYTISVDIVKSLSLPFFDDFSYNSSYPDPGRWIDRNVFINNTMAVDPPSVGVATFDGLNSNGTPYGGGFAQADILTSNYIDLISGVKATDSIFFSYFLQPKGNTYNHQLRDSIELQFKNDTGVWEKVASYKGISPSNPSDYIPPFQQYSIKLDPKFRYNGFQFRFVNYNYRLGVYSTWHLDYVKLAANQVLTLSLDDIAFVAPLSGLLKKYTAIPYKQLHGHEIEELANTTTIQIKNHWLTIPEDIFNTNLTIEELTTSTLILDKDLDNIVPMSQLNPPVGLSIFVNPFDVSEIADEIASVPAGHLPLIFRSTYSYDVGTAEIPALKRNNTTSSITEVGYTMAYDDGTAELNIAAEANNSTKSQIAVKFHLNEGDSLRAIQMHFPRLFDDVSKQLFNIKVWVGSLKETADYTYQLQKPIYADGLFDTLQGFTTYPLVDDLTPSIPKPLYIPAGDYYIGWQQFTVSSAGQYIPVGFDRNYKGGELITYYKSTGDWKPLSEISTSSLLKGIPMIRAKFQNSLLTSSTKDISKGSIINFYPNPTNGAIRIDNKQNLPADSQINVFDARGVKVLTGSINNDIDLSPFAGNLFYIKITGTDGSVLGSSKVVKVD